jgi:predicted LPLAT superfamily acyltransferase
MTEIWQTQRERGSGAMIRLGVWIALRFGYTATRALLYPICLYFFLFSVNPRRASRDYLERVLGRVPGVRDIFRHYHTFAATILDRFYFLAGRTKGYDIEFHGLELIEGYVAERRGCLLLGSHLGSFDVLRVLAGQNLGLTVKVLMFPENSRRIGEILAALNPGLAEAVIPLGKPWSIMEAHRCLANGEFVGLLADRNTRGDKRVATPFLGADAEFPLGPMMLAALAEQPVIMFFGLYRGSRRYDIHFELLAEHVPKEFRKNPEILHELVARYAGRLEAYCRSAPYNWFNFYDFWARDGA